MTQSNSNQALLVYSGYLVFGLFVGAMATTIYLNYYKIKNKLKEKK